MSRKKDEPAPAGPFNNPFAKLGQLREALPSVEQRKEEDAKKPPPKAVVRLERKGRGGKEVTVIEQLELNDEQLTAWIKSIKQALGCGGTIEERSLVLQGDQRERARDWLAAQGVKRIAGDFG